MDSLSKTLNIYDLYVITVYLYCRSITIPSQKIYITLLKFLKLKICDSLLSSIKRHSKFHPISRIIAHNLHIIYNTHQLETRMVKFVHLCLNHCNHVCRSIISSKLHCIKATFASNYKYLSYRYNISHSDWYKDISHLIGKVKLKFQQDFQSRDTAQTLVELCAIRDGLSTCNALSYLDACEQINLISLDCYLYLLCCCT